MAWSQHDELIKHMLDKKIVNVEYQRYTDPGQGEIRLTLSDDTVITIEACDVDDYEQISPALKITIDTKLIYKETI